jgi:hypothetical protein
VQDICPPPAKSKLFGRRGMAAPRPRRHESAEIMYPTGRTAVCQCLGQADLTIARQRAIRPYAAQRLPIMAVTRNALPIMAQTSAPCGRLPDARAASGSTPDHSAFGEPVRLEAGISPAVSYSPSQHTGFHRRSFCTASPGRKGRGALGKPASRQFHSEIRAQDSLFPRSTGNIGQN